jgi:hypothetical protein
VHRGQFEDRIEAGDCASCHTTQGWKPARFDHAKARFPLGGKHGQVACARCHVSVDGAGSHVAAGTPGSYVRYRPLAFASCTACHADPHRDRFGQDCGRCHSPAGWKELRLANFDHSRTRYPLVGKHAQVECAGCHGSVNAAGARVAPGTPDARVQYKPIAFASCTACHRDPHRDRFGQDCARCHSPAGWKSIPAGAFDHDRTDYPLRGAHRGVECQKCHQAGDFKKPLAFARCRDCHADAHAGQLARRSDGGACESCHGVEGFAPARFGPAEHARTRFALRGAHLAVACNACHRPIAPDARRGHIAFHFTSTACAACHVDVHVNQFAAQGGATDCARCHGESTWRIAAFDHDRATRFKLEGAHARTSCTACHRTELISGRRVVRYRPLDVACRSCHADTRKLGR